MDSNCVNCNLHFERPRSSRYKISDLSYKDKYCYKCIQKIGHKCELCTTKIIGTLIHCNNCVNKKQVPCNVCENIIWVYYDIGIHFCKSCLNIKHRVTGTEYCERISSDMIDPNYKLKIRYDIMEESHNGYCSNPYDDTEESRREVVFYPYLKDYPITNINENNMVINLYEGCILLYHKEDVDHGNGYCGMKTKFDIVSAKVIKQVDHI